MKNEDEDSMDFGTICASYLKAFGTVFASKRRSRFGHDFGMLFRRIPGRDVVFSRRLRAVDAPLGAADPPRAAPLFARGEIL